MFSSLSLWKLLYLLDAFVPSLGVNIPCGMWTKSAV